MKLLKKTVTIAILLSLAACASSTPERIGAAAVTPLGDLNVVKSDIPEVLEAARKQPYLMPSGQNCVALSLEIRSLDEALGPDLDTPTLEKRQSLVDRTSDIANDQVVRAIQRTAEDLVPFRGWVRKLSGAERHSKRVAASVAAGSVRRAFLKGVAASQNCLWRTVEVDEAQKAQAASAAG